MQWLLNLGLGGGDGTPPIAPRSNTGKIMLDADGKRFIRDDGLQLEGPDYCRCCPPCEFPAVGTRANYVALVTVSGFTPCTCESNFFATCSGLAILHWNPVSVNGTHVCTWNGTAGEYQKNLGNGTACQNPPGTSAFFVQVAASGSGNGFARVDVGVAGRRAYSNLAHPVCESVTPSNVSCVTTPCCETEGFEPPCCSPSVCAGEPNWQPYERSGASVTLEFLPA